MNERNRNRRKKEKRKMRKKYGSKGINGKLVPKTP